MSTVWAEHDPETESLSPFSSYSGPTSEHDELPLAHESEEQTAVRRAMAAGTRDVETLTEVALRSHADGFDAPTSQEWESVQESVVAPMLSGEAPSRPGGALWVPGAERVANPRSGGGQYVDSPWRFVFHTIEGEPSVHGFRALAARHTNPPHLWAMPSANLLLQTVPLNRSAYALARPGALHTNRMHAVQVELWGFAASMHRVTPDVLHWLADRLLAPVARLVPLDLSVVAPTGSRQCYGAESSCRMTAREWAAFHGVCGHQHVPGNRHWDPGGLDTRAIAARARATITVGGPTRREDEAQSAHDGPGFAAEQDESDEATLLTEDEGCGCGGHESVEAWTEQFAPPAPPLSSLPLTKAPPPAPPSPALTRPFTVSRPCCMLSSGSLRGVTSFGNFRAGQPGIVYTGRAGFVDLGHLWQVVEVTAFAYQTIHAANGASGTTVPTSEGSAKLTSAASQGEWIDLARSIADDDALSHEIDTYAGMTPGAHNSSFSPEDLISNYLGTVVAARALAVGGPFEAEAEKQLKALLVSLDGQSDAETRKAFALISSRWVDTSLTGGILRPAYLRRRNFARVPWKTGHPSDAATPAFVTAPITLTATYDFTHRNGFTRAQFPARIAAIRTQAKAAYGASYDQP